MSVDLLRWRQFWWMTKIILGLNCLLKLNQSCTCFKCDTMYAAEILKLKNCFISESLDCLVVRHALQWHWDLQAVHLLRL